MEKNSQGTGDTVVRIELAAIIGLLLSPIYNEYLGEYLEKFLEKRNKNHEKTGEKNNNDAGKSRW